MCCGILEVHCSIVFATHGLTRLPQYSESLGPTQISLGEGLLCMKHASFSAKYSN